MPLSLRVCKQPLVAGKVLYSAGEEHASGCPAPRQGGHAAAASPDGPEHRAGAAPETAPPAVAAPVKDSGTASITKPSPAPAPAELSEQEKEKWARLGYEQGREKAEAEYLSLRQEVKSKLKEAELCLREARQRSREIIAASEVKVVELAMAAAERLLQTQLEMAPEKVIHIVREAMRLMGGGEKMAVYVSPPDLGACLGMQEKMKAEFSEVNRLEFLPDEALSRGSCRIESENGTAEYLLHEESRQLKEMLLAIARREETKQLEEEEPAYGKH